MAFPFFQRDSKCISVERIDCKDTSLILFLFLFYALFNSSKSATHTHVRFFRAHTQRKFVIKNGLFSLGK